MPIAERISLDMENVAEAPYRIGIALVATIADEERGDKNSC